MRYKYSYLPDELEILLIPTPITVHIYNTMTIENTQDLDIYAMVSQILKVDCPARQAFLQDVSRLCAHLQMAAPEAVFDWSFKIVQEKLCSAVVGLVSAESNGLHFTIAKATSQYLEESFMQTAAGTSRCNSNAIPFLCN
jgi:hypothetical protein